MWQSKRKNMHRIMIENGGSISDKKGTLWQQAHCYVLFMHVFNKYPHGGVDIVEMYQQEEKNIKLWSVLGLRLFGRKLMYCAFPFYDLDRAAKKF